MSYILDALKKAERERGIAQVPTLATVHEAPMESPRRRLWIMAAALLVFAAAIVWTGILFLKSTKGPASSSSNASQLSPSVQSLPSPPAVVPSETVNASQDVTVSNAAPATQVSPNNPQAKKAATTESRAAAATAIPRKQETAAPPKKIPIRPPPEMSSTNPVKTEQLPQPDVLQPNQMSFRESVAKMNMTILMYAEVKSDRLVFINDRKYVEGDYIDGRFLLESITPEGAVLSYQGERLTLRPRAQ